MQEVNDEKEGFAEAVDWALGTTRSVRRKLDWDRPIERRVIEDCIEVAVQAPTGMNQEAWRFLVLDEPGPKAEMASLYQRAMQRFSAATPSGTGPKPAAEGLAERLAEMPALILVCSEGQPFADSNAMQVAFYGSVLPAAWSLMVALRARRIGGTWTTLHLAHEEEAAASLGIPSDVTQTVMIPVGYMAGAKLRPAKRKPAREVTYWNRWGTEQPE